MQTASEFLKRIVNAVASASLAAACVVAQAQPWNFPTNGAVANPESNTSKANPSSTSTGTSSSVGDLPATPGALLIDASTGSSSTEAASPPLQSNEGGRGSADFWHHANGSRKYTFAFAGGLNSPAGKSSNVFTPSYEIQGGVGYNFNRRLGVMFNVGYDHLGLHGSVIQAQQLFYESQNIIDPSTGLPADFSGLDANAHVWSYTLDPIFTIFRGSRLGAFVTGGGGYFHKAVNFTLPQSSYYCDPYYGGCYPITQNSNFDTHSANGGGFDGGGGMTYRLSSEGSLKLFAEVRYAWTNAKLTPEATNPSPISTLDSGSESYVPVTVGFRW